MAKNPKAILRRAAKRAGGFPKLADALGITRHALYQWDEIPANRVIAVEKASGVPRQQLRPDLYANMPGAAA